MTRVLPIALAVGLLAVPAAAVEPLPLYAVLAGRVTDSAGVPQMGASVLLMDRFDRVVSRAVTNDRGGFEFASLLPNLYSVRVSLASFVPALKRNIVLQPGMRSFLAINLASVLSSIELVYMAPGQRALMSDDWKWVLRGAQATRPVLRYTAGVDIRDPAARLGHDSRLFSDTRGLVRLSAGDGGALTSAGTQADLGTAFALATSLFGAAQVAVSGNLGYASAVGTPTAGFSTSVSRPFSGSSPEVNLTVRQMYLPTRIGGALVAGDPGRLPALQTLSLSFVDRRELTEGLLLEVGSTLESVTFLNRLNYLSPFVRLRWGSAEAGAIELAFSSGAPATELLQEGETRDAALEHDVKSLGLFPRVTLRGGQAQVQRTENFEIGYRRKMGSRTLGFAAYKESTSNAALNAAVPLGLYPGELLPDLASNSNVFNIGRFRRFGSSASVTQHFGDLFSATVAYGYSGALAAPAPQLATVDAEELRGALRRAWRQAVTLRFAGVAPGVGTRYAASYQVTDYNTLQPVHLSLTQRSTLEPGLNLYLRQPIPGIHGIFPGRLEASAELRNLLAQGYLPLATPGGHRLLLIQSPRAVRGGLSLIF